MTVNIELHTGSLLSLVVPPDITVKELMKKVVGIVSKKEPVDAENYRLFLPNKGR